MSFQPHPDHAPVSSEQGIKQAAQSIIENNIAAALPDEAAETIQKVQAVANIAQTLAPQLHPGKSGVPTNTPGINGGQPTSPASFDQLDTPTATAIAMAAAEEPAPPPVSGGTGEMLSVKVAADVSVDGNPIKEILSIHISQSMGGHHRLNMRFYQDQVQATGSMTIDGAEKLLGKVAEIELYDASGISGDRLQNLFVIADVQLEQTSLNEGMLNVIGYAPTWLLDGQPHFETFYKKNLKTIFNDITGKALAQVKASLKAEPLVTDTIPFLCRYNESVWNFIKRLSAETGQWLYFNGKELVFGQPEAQYGPTITYGSNCSRINMSLSAQPVPQHIFDYEADKHQPISKTANDHNGNGGGYNDIAFHRSKELFGTIPAVAGQYFLPAKDSLLERVSKARSAQQAAEMYYVTGHSTAYGLRVGINADVALKRLGQSSSHAPIRITHIEHHWDITGKYENQFEGIPAAAEIPPAMTYHKPLTFPMLAEVIDNADNQGRVRVQFMGWQQEGRPETDFIRVLTPDAGNSQAVSQNRGYVFIPEVGDQVFVDFESGNPDKPFVTGSVFHGQNGIGGSADNNIKSITMKNGSTITFDEGKKSITVSDPSQNTIVMDGDGTINISSPKAINISSKDITITASNNINISATANLSHDAEAIGIAAQNGLSMQGKDCSLTGGASINQESPDIKINGKKTGIAGTTITVSGTGDVGITGGLVKINS